MGKRTSDSRYVRGISADRGTGHPRRGVSDVGCGDVFYWAHATFFAGTIIVAERFCGGITEAEKRQLFDEHVRWYSMYGMSMRPVPGTWEEFQEYWQHMATEVLENNKAARDVLDLTGLPGPPFAQWMPNWMWSAQRGLLGNGFGFAGEAPEPSWPAPGPAGGQ